MLSLPSYSLKEVRSAWDLFTQLGQPWISESGYGGSHPSHYKAREDAWKFYCKIRDHYLYGLGTISLNQLNEKWYPKMYVPSYSVHSIHKN